MPPPTNRMIPAQSSGTISSGGNAQAAIAANPDRLGWMLQNQSTEDMYVRDDGTAATADKDSVKVPPGAIARNSPEYVSPKAISVIAATTGSAYYAEEAG